MLETAGWEIASTEVRACLESTVERLRKEGVEVVTRHTDSTIAEIEASIVEANPRSRAINNWEGRWPLNVYRERDASGLSEEAMDHLAAGEAMTLEEYQALIAQRTAVRTGYARLAGAVDGCITLSAPGPAPKGLASTGDPIFVVPGSYLGIPTLSLPLFSAEGLPLGFQVMGFEQQDAAAYSLASWLDHTLST